MLQLKQDHPAPALPLPGSALTPSAFLPSQEIQKKVMF